MIDQGSATATQLRTFLEDNQVDLGELINNLVTTGDVIVKHLPGIAQILVIYPTSSRAASQSCPSRRTPVSTTPTSG